MKNMDNIPFGYCHCGCGGKTTVSTKTDKCLGRIKGQPMKFVSGHNVKIGPNNPWWKGGQFQNNRGYIETLAPDHPNSNKHGYMKEHRLVCEKTLGKHLPPKAVVHHVNGVNDDNRPANLVVCQDLAYHNLLHRRERALKACGHANWRKCRYCNKWDNLANLVLTQSPYHRDCAIKYAQKWYLSRKSDRIAKSTYKELEGNP